MLESQARWGRVAAGVAALTVMATMASCSATGSGAPTTLTQTVTVSGGSGSGAAPPSGTSGVTAGSGTTDSSGAPITVVGPNAVTTAAETPSSPAAGSGKGQQPPAADASGAPGSDDPAATSAGPAATTATTPAVDTAESRAAARMVAASCPTVLSARDIAAALRKSLPAQTIRVEDVANPDNKMTARTKCYYGTGDIGASRPLVVAIAGFPEADAAAQQRDVTLASEKAAGATVSNSDIAPGDGRIKIMVRDGGLAVTQVGAATVSIAIDRGVIAPAALRSALTMLTRAVVSHVR